ncbi:hypothetical protein AXE65_11990 [Ventosimonas gracilis]|uniref:YdbS-like PH domain-containing protein n=1 Tax=Ventosimonas gracilis TaxID=1680762 RepID=A0A139SWH5_9GAMM|nr:PH domain-containing protein [Ventosimonas gracilis]KXU38780.1 hypothetical protein AXE65_11990 [Ventosimonas gracilis]
MASYIESTLISGEKIIAEARLSLWSMWLEIVLGVVLLPLVVGLYFLIRVYLRYISTELAFTNKRVIAKFGFIRRQTIELQISKIESIQVEQGILGRIFDYGTLIISGAGNPQAPIPGISQPMQFRQAFMQHQDQQSS